MEMAVQTGFSVILDHFWTTAGRVEQVYIDALYRDRNTLDGLSIGRYEQVVVL